MSFCRFNYDDSRTIKKLQESTGFGRYALNMSVTALIHVFLMTHN